MGSPRLKDQEDAKNRSKDTYMDGGQPSVKVKGRGCTDIICCMLFVLCIVFMLAITGFSIAEGDLEKIATKFDQDGVKCEGDHPYKLFTRLMPVRKYKNKYGLPAVANGGNPNVAYYSVCVDKCPKDGTKDIKYVATKQYPKNDYELKTWDHDTESVVGFCFPSKDLLKGLANLIFSELNESVGGFGKYMKDLQESWKLMLLMSFVALVITMLYLFLLQWITKPILYVSLVLILVFGLLVTVFLFFEADKYPEESDDYKMILAACCVTGILTLLYVIFLCCQCKNIAIAADIMAASGEFVSTNPRIILVPLICYLICFPIVFWYAAVNAFMYSTGEPKFVKDKMFAEMENQRSMEALFWIFMFCFFWVMAFIISILQFTIAATTALWYFKHSNSDAPAASVMTSVGWAFRYHLGSLAFGAFLIAVTTMIKVIFEYFAKKYEKLSGDNCIVKAVLCYIRYYIWCLDACVKFISGNAYIQVAINGYSFCEAAKKSFFMIVANPGTYTAMQLVGWIMTGIGRGVIIGVSVYLTVILAQQNVLVATEGATIQQPFVPAFVVFLIAFLVAALFISIFDFACLTILQCFITCKECGGDSNGKVFAPKSLRGYLRKAGEDEALFEDDAKPPTTGTETAGTRTHQMD